MVCCQDSLRRRGLPRPPPGDARDAHEHEQRGAGHETREKQADVIKVWYKKHKHRLAWDTEKRKYYLKPEGKK